MITRPKHIVKLLHEFKNIKYDLNEYNFYEFNT